jgi:hypothetical protein
VCVVSKGLVTFGEIASVSARVVASEPAADLGMLQLTRVPKGA